MKSSFAVSLACVLFLFACFGACDSKNSKLEKPMVVEEISLGGSTDFSNLGLAKLSEYGLFEGTLSTLTPTANVIPYSLNTPLFSDYSYKARFVRIPSGSQALYHDTEVFDFPEGTVLIKNFYYPLDFQHPEGDRKIIETRLLINEGGIWKALSYVWNDEQTDAYLEVAGKNVPISWKHSDGQIKQISYSVPNMNQCKSCHDRSDKIVPIGPSARQLNGSYNQQANVPNQLEAWNAKGLLANLPELHLVPRLAVWNNLETGTLDQRARAWLEINCSSCHREDGPAKTSGLHLLSSVTDPYKLGIGKAPVAAGKGSGGRKFDIVPGKAEESILYFRINSTHPGIMMPELGRRLIHEEGVALIRDWINNLE